MYELFVEETFSAAHRLPGYNGACERLHGHNWKVRAYARASSLDDEGMAWDFARFKKSLRSILSELDHRNLDDVPELGGIPSTAEHLARWIYDRLDAEPRPPTVRIHKVVVWEGERSAAAYFED